MANEVSVLLTVEEKQALNAISKVIKATDKLGQQSKKSGKELDATFSSFKGNLAALAASKAFSFMVSGIKSVVSAASELEVYETQFKTILGSTKAAKDQLKELQDFAANTPFQLPGLAVSTRQLLSFGVSQRDIIPTLKQLGDVASGAGAEITELTIPFGRLVASQKLTLIELDKFADRGINIFKELSDQTGISMGNIRKAVTDNKIPFSEFEKALSSMTSEGGMFFGGMEKQSQTLSGVLSTLEDNFFNLKGEVGKAFSPLLIAGAKSMTTIMQELADIIRDPTLGEQLEKNGSRFAVVSSEIKRLTGEIAQVKKEGGFLEQFKLNDKTKQLRFLNEEMERLSLEQEKQRLTQKAGDAGSSDIPDVAAVASAFDEIAIIEAERKAVKAENLLLEKDARGEASTKELEEIRAFEVERLKIKRDADLERASFITDTDKKQRDTDLINAKAKLDIEKASGKASIALAKEIDAKKTANQASTFATIATMSSSSNSALAAIGKAAGITQIAIQTPIAIAKALAAFPPPFGFVAAGLVGAAMATQAAQIAGISGFESGGVVGGFSGASLGLDNSQVNVRSGEMILNASQQKNLFEDINSGGGNKGGNPELMAALSAPIIIEVDNKEIARANRTAMLEGFSAA
jgi:hypothetical protein